MKSWNEIRHQFPVLGQKIHQKRYAFLDSAASSQMPVSVIETVSNHHKSTHANVHRGVYWASVESTERLEAVRKQVAHFIGAEHPEEIIFTSGTTDALNLVAHCWGRTHLQKGDVVLMSIMEHHSHLVPWQQVAKEKGARVIYVGLTADGRLNLNEYRSLMTAHRPKVVAMTQMANSLGTITPIEDIVREARRVGALVCVDGAQGVPHLGARVKDWDVDFLAFSSHKMCGPTGLGVLYGKKKILESLPPYRFGGDMILKVSEQDSQWNAIPHKFEAGTPNISGILGLGAAITFLNGIGFSAIREHEQELTGYALRKLSEIDGMEIFGIRENTSDRGGVISFNIKGIHPHDVGTILDTHGVAVRVGHHCAQPLMDYLKQSSTVRMSFYVYTTKEDIDQAITALRAAGEYFHG